MRLENKNRYQYSSDRESESEDNVVMVPWYKRTDRIAPNGNYQLETGLERLREHLFNPDNRRRVRDNLTHDQREAIDKLRNLPNTSNAQVSFEDKGSRFVIRNLNYQDRVIMDQLADVTQFDEVIDDPTQHVVRRIENFCEKWKSELEEFHPNIIGFLTDLSETK